MKRFPVKLLAILPALILIWLVWRYGVNLPVWDEWDTPGAAMVQTATNQMTWGHWISQHNESRKLFPRLLFVPLASFTSWNIRSEMLVSILLACLISVSVYCLSKITLNCSPIRRIACLFFANLLIFSPMQWDNWLWGLQAITFVPIACITASLAVIFASNPLIVKFIVSGILATIATFSFANGMLSWIIIMPSLIWVTSKTKNTKKITVIALGWLALFGFNLAIYFHDYIKPSSTPGFSESLVNPFNTIAYFLSFIGSPLGFHSLVSNQIIGLIILVFFGLSCFYILGIKENRPLLNRAFPWISIGIYTIASGTLTTAGRVGFGVAQSLESRYVTFSTYGVLALIYLLTIIDENIKHKNLKFSRLDGLFPKTISFLCVAFLLVYPANFAWGANKMITVNHERLYAKACLIFINQIDNPDCLKYQIYPRPTFLVQRANELNSLGYLQPALATSDRLENISGQNLLGVNYGNFDGLSRDDDGNYLTWGWSVLPKYNQPAHAVVLAYQTQDNVEHAFALAKPEQNRPDVVETLGKQQYSQSGWSKSFASDLIPSDAVAISAWAFDSNIGRAYKLNLVQQLEQ
ncbi:MAG: hypothetical protein AAGF83_06250 [Cyanobacteria bacterium P01_G01_bin.67]